MNKIEKYKLTIEYPQGHGNVLAVHLATSKLLDARVLREEGITFDAIADITTDLTVVCRQAAAIYRVRSGIVEIVGLNPTCEFGTIRRRLPNGSIVINGPIYGDWPQFTIKYLQGLSHCAQIIQRFPEASNPKRLITVLSGVYNYQEEYDNQAEIDEEGNVVAQIRTQECSGRVIEGHMRFETNNYFNGHEVSITPNDLGESTQDDSQKPTGIAVPAKKR